MRDAASILSSARQRIVRLTPLSKNALIVDVDRRPFQQKVMEHFACNFTQVIQINVADCTPSLEYQLAAFEHAEFDIHRDSVAPVKKSRYAIACLL
jgi:hypothetical protein